MPLFQESYVCATVDSQQRSVGSYQRVTFLLVTHPRKEKRQPRLLNQIYDDQDSWEAVLFTAKESKNWSKSVFIHTT
jgi:hypothetical protein